MFTSILVWPVTLSPHPHWRHTAGFCFECMWQTIVDVLISYSPLWYNVMNKGEIPLFCTVSYQICFNFKNPVTTQIIDKN